VTSRTAQTGYTLIELLVSIGIAALLLTGLQQLLGVGIDTLDAVERRTELARRARFAMSRMVDAVQHSDRLLIPLANNPTTPFDENLREQTVPASPPQFGSVLATAVLALTISPDQDMDANGIADADNDGDGRIDEDLPADAHNDGKAGVRDIDDDGNGSKDFFLSPAGDDDESNDFKQSEDPFNGIDDDGDGSIDEDGGADMNGDLAPGVAGVDDDGDGNVDEGNVNDDDEDGAVDEDWFDPVVFYLNGNRLVERRAVPWDANLDSTLNGRDFVESDIGENITLLRFERLPPGGGQQLIDITLRVAGDNSESITLNTRVRQGGAR
jgi:prepilin-type N-terminal cleavage/methylation domain-containing protein